MEVFLFFLFLTFPPLIYFPSDANGLPYSRPCSQYHTYVWSWLHRNIVSDAAAAFGHLEGLPNPMKFTEEARERSKADF